MSIATIELHKKSVFTADRAASSSEAMAWKVHGVTENITDFQ